MKKLKNSFCFLFALSSVMYSSFTFAQVDPQVIICDLWGDMTESHFGNFEVFKQSGDVDPIASTKKLANYEDYDTESAGGIMLSTIFSGLENGQAMQEVREKVIGQCHSFPADAVDPSNEYDPVSDFK